MSQRVSNTRSGSTRAASEGTKLSPAAPSQESQRGRQAAPPRLRAAQRRSRVQVVLQLMPGAEPWIRVEHSAGWFKVPAGVSVQEIYIGATEKWQDGARRLRTAEPTIRVPLSVARAAGIGV